MCRFFFFLLLSLGLVSSCQTNPHFQNGIQKDYTTALVGGVAAVPVFVVPDPVAPASIDPVILSSKNIIDKIQNKISESFDAQPFFNGYDFNVVAKIIGPYKPSSEKNKQTLQNHEQMILWDNMNRLLNVMADRSLSQNFKMRFLMSPSCLSRKSFIEFYSFCLKDDPHWVSNLNDLSSHVLNVDSALLVALENLDSKKTSQNSYGISMKIAVVLVDTNNGNLIWGNENSASLTQDNAMNFPSWDSLIDKVFDSYFWQGFPNRIPSP